MATLKEARFARGWTQWDLKLRSGVHVTRISLFEQGYTLPTVKEKEALAIALEVPADDLVFKIKTT